MAGSFQRMIKRLQNFMFGEETDEWEETQPASEQSDSNRRYPKAGKRKPESRPRVFHQQETGAKIFHQYPKEGKFRFPLDVEDKKSSLTKPRESSRPSRPNKTKQNSSTSAEYKTKSYREDINSTEEKSNRQNWEKPQPQQSKQENKTYEKAAYSTERSYFQGNDFAPEDIPSPVFGFEKVQLHPDNLKKKNESITPVTHDKEEYAGEGKAPVNEESDYEPFVSADSNVFSFITNEETAAGADTSEMETDSDILEESYEEKEINAFTDESQARFSNRQEEKEEVNTKDAPTQENHSKPDENLTSGTEKSEESPTYPQPAEEQPLPDQKQGRTYAPEKRIRRDEKRKNKNEKQKPSVPFNVLMYPSDKKRKEKNPVKEGNAVQKGQYHFPGLQLLNVPPRKEDNGGEALQKQRDQLEATLHNFNVNAKVVDVTRGPSVTRFEVQPAPGVKVNKITNLTDDIKLALAAKDLRMEAPIPGKNAIGIEVPNPESTPVFLREILRRDVFTRSDSPLTVAMGLDISGNPIVADLQKMPHGLIAGATGSGKSVCINSILLSLLYKASPEELKLMLIDPKMVELASFKDVPHLVTPVINDAKQATAGLKWAVEEMESRYEKLAHEGVRDIKKYNERMMQQENPEKKMPYIVIIIDELADLMMVSPQDVEDAVCRIAQKARACGIHLLLATQRPSVDVITGLIKANIPSRTAFAVSSQADSRTILDMGGAERLIGKGDMLFHENGSPKPIRVQGTFVTDEEIDAVTDFVKKQREPSYLFKREELVKKVDQQESGDELFEEACIFVVEQGSASSSSLQRRFSIGYNRAAKLIDMMENRGIISESMGSKPRRVLMTYNEIEDNILA
ncbi:DNA translocase FtsK [Alteribacillus sp. JSM 102045]|uniref:DNA translocase FtsK n=1 Tax=Alteribacillus sp. JSM 102045 TaxID=1562101 RepID=UPI0035C12840